MHPHKSSNGPNLLRFKWSRLRRYLASQVLWKHGKAKSPLLASGPERHEKKKKDEAVSRIRMEPGMRASQSALLKSSAGGPAKFLQFHGGSSVGAGSVARQDRVRASPKFLL